MQKDKKLEEDKILFKGIKEEKTCIKAEHKAPANFILIKSYVKTQGKAGAIKKKKELVNWPKYKKYGCNYLANQGYKHANKKYEKCRKKNIFLASMIATSL